MSLINLSMRLDQFKHNQLFVIDRETSFICEIMLFLPKKHPASCTPFKLVSTRYNLSSHFGNFKGVSRCLKLRQRFSRDEILNQEYRLDSFSISFHQFSVWDAV